MYIHFTLTYCEHFYTISEVSLIIVQYTVGEHSLIITYTHFVTIDPIISEVSLIGEPKHIIVVTIDEHMPDNNCPQLLYLEDL